ncbi:hypothetical protein [Streptomyces sp. NPDC087538]|uniref:hypothetical protein n=1 Tax=Streptomyces sp. NPDC087538 TaxID=3365797 RepID=UPI0037F42748
MRMKAIDEPKGLQLHCRHEDPEGRREDTITVQTRNQVRHLLVLDYDSVTGGDQDPSIPAVDIAFAADPGMTGPCGIRSCSAPCLSRTGAAGYRGG